MPEYFAAVVCERGHVIESMRSPAEKSSDGAPPDTFCSHCGAPTLSACPGCSMKLRGVGVSMGVPLSIDRPYPYCYRCGDPYPWTQRALAAITALAEEDGSLESEEVAQLSEAAARLGDEQDSPEATLAVSRIKRLSQKLSGPAREAMMKIATDVASATIRAQLGQ